MKHFSITALSLLHFIFFPAVNSQETIQGTVFFDNNKNGILDRGEKGISGVVVSNQETVTKTDENGQYSIQITDPGTIFIVKPSGFELPLNELNLPRFYYHHHTKGSPDHLYFDGISPTGPLPEKLNFGLLKAKDEKEFSVIVVGDPQPDTIAEVYYYRDDIVKDMLDKSARFYLALGDIVGDDLDLLHEINKVVEPLDIPAYNVFGNHDRNYFAIDPADQTATFKSIYGPDYYSFDYGDVHFIVLNTVDYAGYDTINNRPRGYKGGLDEKQFTWLKNDLALVPEEKLVVISGHIPFYPNHFQEGDAKRLFKIMESREKLLALSGHLHTNRNEYFTRKDYWFGTTLFPVLVVGAGSGSWYSFPKDERSLPFAVQMDGVPNGYFIFNFKENQYNYQYYPSGMPHEHQFRISYPYGTLHLTPDTKKEVIVNVYAGNAKSKVYCSWNGEEPAKMHQFTGKDPYVEQLVSNHKNQLKSWVSPATTDHLWSAPWPEDINKGIHTITVAVTDEFGRTYKDQQIIELK